MHNLQSTMLKCKALSSRSEPFVASRSNRDRESTCYMQSWRLRRRKVPNHFLSDDWNERFWHDRQSRLAGLMPRKRSAKSSKMMFVLLILLSSATSTWGQQTTPAPAAPPISGNGTDTASPTIFPTTPAPSLNPTTSGPTVTPSTAPTAAPTLSASPTASFAPSLSPSLSLSPTASPSLSQRPSPSPSAAPTISRRPSSLPTINPTAAPSVAPSDFPSQLPSYNEPFFDQADFRTIILVSQREQFNETEEELISMLYESYTDDIAPEAIRTRTLCQIKNQDVVDCFESNSFCTDWGVNVSDPNSLEGYTNYLDFSCNYTSTVTNVTGYPDRLARYTDSNAGLVTVQMQQLDLPVIRANAAAVRRPPPTESPTSSPVAAPSVSIAPTPVPRFPTAMPSFANETTGTEIPTFLPTNSVRALPSGNPTVGRTLSPSLAIPANDDGGSSNAVIVGVVVSVGIISLVGLLIFYRQRQKSRGPVYSAAASAEEQNKAASPNNTSYKNGHRAYEDDSEGGQVHALLSPSESLVSKHSLISAPGSGLGDDSDPEADGTRNLQDEFDQYKDQNLDNFRSEVEGNMPGFEGVMSAAVTRALMGDEDHEQEIPEEAYWGCSGTPTGPEIEASALWEVDDWLKRNEVDAQDRKRVFFADILNRMVTSVRFGVVQAEDGSRTIHESAALLNLKLVNELPMTTVVISGMRKTGDAHHMMSVLREFGDIDVAAVASRQKGFGIVRFRHPKSVDKVMRRYRSGEIEIQEVAVQVKALMPSGAVIGRN